MNVLFDRLFDTQKNKKVFIKYSENKEPLTYDRFLQEIEGLNTDFLKTNLRPSLGKLVSQRLP